MIFERFISEVANISGPAGNLRFANSAKNVVIAVQDSSLFVPKAHSNQTLRLDTSRMIRAFLQASFPFFDTAAHLSQFYLPRKTAFGRHHATRTLKAIRNGSQWRRHRRTDRA